MNIPALAQANAGMASRAMPANEDTERRLLSLCFAFPHVAKSAIEATISPSSFFNYQHATIFAAIADANSKGTGTEIADISENLIRDGKLGAAGGWKTLMDCSALADVTDYRANEYIDKLKELEAKREYVKTAMHLAEAAYSPSTTAEEVREVLESRTGISNTHGHGYPLERIQDLVFNDGDEDSPEAVRFWVKGVVACTVGSLSTVIAQAKVGKSAWVSAFLSAYWAKRNGIDDCIDLLGIRSADAQGALIHFDTEQSPNAHRAVVRRAMRRARTDTSTGLVSVRLTTIATEARLPLIKKLIQWHAKRGGVHAVIIDGAADLMLDINDLAESVRITNEIHALSITCETHIMCVIHDNEGAKTNGDARGHIGKQLMRKSESNFLLKKKEGVTVVYSEKMRQVPIFEKDGVRFAWSELNSMHSTCLDSPPPATKGKTQGRPKAYAFAAIAEHIPSGEENAVSVAEIYRLAAVECGISRSGLNTLLAECKNLNMVFVAQVSGKYYR